MHTLRQRSRRHLFRAAILGLTGSTAAGAALPVPARKEQVAGMLRLGELLFVGGIGGWYPNRRPEGPGDVRQQMSDALEILKGRLEAAGSSLDHVLKVQVALVDPQKNWAGMDEVYDQYFREPRPVRNFFGTTSLLRPGSLLQLDCIAYVDQAAGR